MLRLTASRQQLSASTLTLSGTISCNKVRRFCIAAHEKFRHHGIGMLYWFSMNSVGMLHGGDLTVERRGAMLARKLRQRKTHCCYRSDQSPGKDAGARRGAVGDTALPMFSQGCTQPMYYTPQYSGSKYSFSSYNSHIKLTRN